LISEISSPPAYSASVPPLFCPRLAILSRDAVCSIAAVINYETEPMLSRRRYRARVPYGILAQIRSAPEALFIVCPAYRLAVTFFVAPRERFERFLHSNRRVRLVSLGAFALIAITGRAINIGVDSSDFVS